MSETEIDLRDGPEWEEAHAARARANELAAQAAEADVRASELEAEAAGVELPAVRPPDESADEAVAGETVSGDNGADEG